MVICEEFFWNLVDLVLVIYLVKSSIQFWSRKVDFKKKRARRSGEKIETVIRLSLSWILVNLNRFLNDWSANLLLWGFKYRMVPASTFFMILIALFRQLNEQRMQVLCFIFLNLSNFPYYLEGGRVFDANFLQIIPFDGLHRFSVQTEAHKDKKQLQLMSNDGPSFMKRSQIFFRPHRPMRMWLRLWRHPLGGATR